MLGAIKETLLGIADFFAKIVDVVVFLIEEIFGFFEIVTEAIASIPEWYVLIPSGIVTLVTGLVAAKFILRLVGRS